MFFNPLIRTGDGRGLPRLVIAGIELDWIGFNAKTFVTQLKPFSLRNTE